MCLSKSLLSYPLLSSPPLCLLSTKLYPECENEQLLTPTRARHRYGAGEIGKREPGKATKETVAVAGVGDESKDVAADGK